MILKMRLDGDQYKDLLAALQDDKNYAMQTSGVVGDKPQRQPFVKLLKGKSVDDHHPASDIALRDHDVTLEVPEQYYRRSETTIGPESVFVPLDVLKNVFEAIGLFPDGSVEAPKE